MKIRLMMVRDGRPATVELSSAQAVFKFMRPKCRRLDREYLWRIDLDVRSRVIGYEVLCGQFHQPCCPPTEKRCATPSKP